MKKILLIFLFNISVLVIFSQNHTFGEDDNSEKEYFFAIRLMPNLNGSLIQCAVMKKDAKHREDIFFLTADSWIRQAAGFETSPANPEKENLIEKYNIFEIPANVKKIGNSEITRYTIKKTEAILNNLWRLKYSEFPYYNPEKNNEKGWAKHPDIKITWLPSEAQMQILRTFGIQELSDFFVGENVFNLLKEVRNRDWQNRYIQSAGVYYEEPEGDSIPNN
ncbi:MAG: hypothetical protein L3J35_02650 [Bacteroidales bacterium]|nr:hypothetical protein [Bacteroidales bacterium]